MYRSGGIRGVGKKLAGVAAFFPEPAAYTFFQDHPLEMSLPSRLLGPGQRERLAGHAPLHAYLVEAPPQPVSLTETDLSDYRQASKLFILLGSLAHLYANSASEPTPLPTCACWRRSSRAMCRCW